MKRIIFILLAISFTFGLNAQKSNWYKTEKFDPSARLVIHGMEMVHKRF